MPRTKKATKSKQKSRDKATLQERLAAKRAKRAAKQKFITLISICLFLGLLLGLPIGVLVSPKFGLAAIVAPTVLICSYQYPRMALWGFLIYMPFSGTITYWIGGGNALFQLAKDAFYIPALIALFQECRNKGLPVLIPKKLIPTFVLLVTFTLATLFLVNLPQQFLPYCSDLTTRGFISQPCRDGMPFLQGILGLKVFLGYIPLIFCAYYLIDNKKKLLFLGRLLVVLAIICCSLGILQFFLLKTGSCQGTRGAVGEELFKATLNAKCLVGGSLVFSPSQNAIRLPGTFVSPWHWAWFLVANSAICFSVAFSDNAPFWRLMGSIGMGLVFINSVICGQRLSLALVPAVIIVLSILTGQIANFKKFIPIAIGLSFLLGIWIVSNPSVVSDRIDSFVGRWQASPPQQFIIKQFKYSINQQRGIFGRGLGKGTNSTRILGNTALIETYHPKLLYELGWFGLLAFIIFVTYLTIFSYGDYRSIRDPTLRSFSSSFWVFILIISYIPYWYPLDTDPVAVYYWFMAGVIFRLSKIDREERHKLRQIETDNSSKKRSRVRKGTRARRLNLS